MPQYILRDLDQRLWIRFKERAQREGWHLRALFLQLLEDYASGKITLSRSASSTPDVGQWPLLCPNGHATIQVFSKEEAADWLARGYRTLACLTCGADVEVTQEERDTLESWIHTTSTDYPSRSEAWATMHAQAFTDLRGEAQHLIDSSAKYLEPLLALAKTEPIDLYTRFAKQLELLRQNRILKDDQVPDSRFWVGRWRDSNSESLDRKDLGRLISEANHVLTVLHQRVQHR